MDNNSNVNNNNNVKHNNIKIDIEKINMINELNDIINEKKFNVESYLKEDYENSKLVINKFLLDNNEYDLAEYDYFFNIDEIVINGNKKNI